MALTTLTLLCSHHCHPSPALFVLPEWNFVPIEHWLPIPPPCQPATAKSFQSCPTLCDPIDGSPPGSPVPGILQARTLEWVAISFSSVWKWKVKVKSLSRVRLLATPWTAAYQAPPSMGFSRQEYWSGVPLPSPPYQLRQAVFYFLSLWVWLLKAPHIRGIIQCLCFCDWLISSRFFISSWRCVFKICPPWLIHVNVWQNPLQYCKIISLQLIKIK